MGEGVGRVELVRGVGGAALLLAGSTTVTTITRLTRSVPSKPKNPFFKTKRYTEPGNSNG